MSNRNPRRQSNKMQKEPIDPAQQLGSNSVHDSTQPSKELPKNEPAKLLHESCTQQQIYTSPQMYQLPMYPYPPMYPQQPIYQPPMYPQKPMYPSMYGWVPPIGMQQYFSNNDAYIIRMFDMNDKLYKLLSQKVDNISNMLIETIEPKATLPALSTSAPSFYPTIAPHPQNDKDNYTSTFVMPTDISDICSMLFGKKPASKPVNLVDQLKLPDMSINIYKKNNNNITRADDYVEMDLKNIADIIKYGEQFSEMISTFNAIYGHKFVKQSDKDSIKDNSDNESSEESSDDLPTKGLHLPKTSCCNKTDFEDSNKINTINIDVQPLVNKLPIVYNDSNLINSNKTSNNDDIIKNVFKKFMKSIESTKSSEPAKSTKQTGKINKHKIVLDSESISNSMKPLNEEIKKYAESLTTFKNMTETDEIKRDNDGLYSFFGKRYSVNPRKIMKLRKPLQLLQSMVGLNNIRKRIYQFVVTFLQNTKSAGMLNSVIYGKPGVGKTDLGKILCMIYSALEIVPSSRFSLVKATQLLGRYVGETRQKTLEVLNDAEGGVLFLDEAYSLASGNGKNDSSANFGKECVDTINQELSENRRKLVIIIAGYEADIQHSFFDMNPGLDRRFPFRFTLKEYSAQEMKDIFLRMIRLEEEPTFIDENIKESNIIDMFSDARYFENSGGDIENLIVCIKMASNERTIGKYPNLQNLITKEDLKNGLESFKINKKLQDHPCQHIYA